MRTSLGFPSDSPCLSSGRRAPFLLFVLVSLGLIPAGVGADVFKWVDEEGKVHYGDSPPQERDVQTIRTPPPPSGSAVLQSRSRLDSLRDRETEAERERARGQEKQAAARERGERKRRCRQAQRSLRVLEIDRPVFRVDERGNKVYLEDDQRAAELERLRKAVKADCR